jgi:hypothetical protein
MLRCACTALAGSPTRSVVATAYRCASPRTDRPRIGVGSPCERTNSGDQAGGAGCEQGCAGRGEPRLASAVVTLRRAAILHISGRLVLELGVLAIDRLPTDCHRIVRHARHGQSTEPSERRQGEHRPRLRQRGGTGSRRKKQADAGQGDDSGQERHRDIHADSVLRRRASRPPKAPVIVMPECSAQQADGQSRSAATGAPATGRPRWIPGPRSPRTVRHGDAQGFRMS